MKIDGLENKIINYLTNQLEIELIYLFGSYVKGNFNKDSDIDIAVYLKKDKSKLEIFNFKKKLEDMLERDIDLVILNNANDVLKNQVLYYGKNIFAKDEEFKQNYEYISFVNYLSFQEDIKIVIDKIKERGAIFGTSSIE